MDILKINDRNQIALPKDIRKQFDLKAGDYLTCVDAGDGFIIMRKLNLKSVMEPSHEPRARLAEGDKP